MKGVTIGPARGFFHGKGSGDVTEEWYENKELFDMIQGLKEDLQETRTVVRKYNDIRRELNNVMQRLACIENERETRDKMGQKVRDWGGWIVAILSLIITILITTGVM